MLKTRLKIVFAICLIFWLVACADKMNPLEKCYKKNITKEQWDYLYTAKLDPSTHCIDGLDFDDRVFTKDN